MEQGSFRADLCYTENQFLSLVDEFKQSIGSEIAQAQKNAGKLLVMAVADEEITME